MKQEMQTLLARVRENALQGIPATVDDCMALAALSTEGDEVSAAEADEHLNALCDAADEVRKRLTGNGMDTCSIINGRSGRCTENCKWCSQAAAHHTGCDEYDFIDEKTFIDSMLGNSARGVKRFSIVCSGRKVAMKDIRRFCDLYRRGKELEKERNPQCGEGISLCASMGLLNREELQALYDAGIRRYHCNLETSASYFPHLCTSHTREDKLRTIRAAREVGMEVCSGGIIGMGESLRQRLEMAEEAREAGAVSIPVNLLNPIKGTPLEGTPLIGEREVTLTVALMRMVAPALTLRFAGGRMRLSREATVRILHGGMNGALVGDMLTTVGNNVDEDFTLFRNEKFDV